MSIDFRDDLFILAITIKQEAEGEPYEGKLSVAHVIINRGGSISDTCLRPFQFSCWNTDSQTRMRIDTMEEDMFKECFKAACSAFFRLEPDPTMGATHYLNVELTKELRGGTLPAWFDEAKVTAKIGKHTFLKGV